MTRLEAFIHIIIKTIFRILNPLKKMIIHTECQVHKHINLHALTILKNDNFQDQYFFFRDSLDQINKGAVWADQDFKSSNHFYNPYKKKEAYTEEAMHWNWLRIITPKLFSIGK